MHFWGPTNLGSFYYQAGYRNRNFYSDPYVSFDLGGTQIKYDAVTEYYLVDGVYQQKTQTRYEWGDNDELVDFIVHDYDNDIWHPRKYSNPENAWKTPVMTEKDLYKYNNGSFDLLRRESYSYGYIAGITTNYEAFDMPTYLHTQVVYARDGGGHDYDNYTTAKQYHDNSCSVYGYGIRRYASSKLTLSALTVEEFTSQDTMTTEKQYEYDSTYNFFVKNEKITNSKGQLIKTVYTYPHEYPADSVYQQMVQKNILAAVVTQTDSVGNIQRKKMVTNYFKPYTNIFVPESIEVKNGSGVQYTAANFNRYDNHGNILEQQKTNDVKEVYLWGYNSKYPVAKIIGTDYQTASGYITQSILDTPSGDAALRAHLNSLRTIPNTLVTTYTYKPLIGVTSESDVSNRVTYYEYDNFNRLTLIRDQDRNVIKRICYNYAGQPENCMTYGNVLKTGPFQRLNCGEDSVGTYVIDSIQPNTFYGASQPEADSLALSYLNATGQAYANEKGSCFVCNTTNCPGVNYKCVNGVCTEGGRYNVSTTRVRINGVFVWQCVYHYCWTDGSTSADFTETNDSACAPVGVCEN